MSNVEPIEPRSPAEPSPAHPRLLGLLAPLLIVAIFEIAFQLRIGWPKWPIVNASDRIVAWIIGSAIVAAVADLFASTRLRRVAVPLLAFVAAVVCLWPTLEAKRTGAAHWTDATLMIHVAAIALLTAIGASILAALAERDRDRPLVPLVLAGMALATGAITYSSGSIRLGETTFCFAGGVVLVSLVAGLFLRGFARSNGAAVLACVGVATQFANGSFWSEVPVWCIACVAAAPLLACVVFIGPLARRPRWMRVAVALIIAALPAMVAVGKTGYAAWKAADAPSSQQDEAW